MPVVNTDLFNLESRDEIRPTNDALIIRSVPGGVELAKARWWLVPHFYTGPLKDWKATTFNARSETIQTMPSYREAFRHRRCLVPATGWWEWKDEGGPRKQKYWVEPADGAPMMFAGIWDRAETSDQGPIESFSIVTQPAGALSALHHRAPLVLWTADWASWVVPSGNVQPLLDRAPEDRFQIMRQ